MSWELRDQNGRSLLTQEQGICNPESLIPREHIWYVAHTSHEWTKTP